MTDAKYPPCDICDCFGNACKLPGDSAQYEWPELIGVEIMKAKVVVERVNPAITGVPLKDKGYFASVDPSYCNRVLLCSDGNGLIRVKPVVG
ncbi:hypothetical protein FXO38_13785 [Capsicum annuum]|uniref:Uncharacterized protein n=1 Tax=Capsicum annuum TaxID=4072 RepID=A0A2G3AE96_CAPAN|nr:hypothetical protein FXO37_23171 [Capsicum annuum]KAF3657211.1 hypothetical protein FXO38_13785 [Capsicum annuum]PHT92566.1 hypothetical protein T459_00448 [Capsicum annuum]